MSESKGLKAELAGYRRYQIVLAVGEWVDDHYREIKAEALRWNMQPTDFAVKLLSTFLDIYAEMSDKDIQDVMDAESALKKIQDTLDT
jgi:hypothetical protein